MLQEANPGRTVIGIVARHRLQLTLRRDGTDHRRMAPVTITQDRCLALRGIRAQSAG